jgi:hypothetical protein
VRLSLGYFDTPHKISSDSSSPNRSIGEQDLVNRIYESCRAPESCGTDGDRGGWRRRNGVNYADGAAAIVLNLNRYLAADARIPRSVNLPHSARTDTLQNLVGPQAFTGRQRHGSGNSLSIMRENRP